MKRTVTALAILLLGAGSAYSSPVPTTVPDERAIAPGGIVSSVHDEIVATGLFPHVLNVNEQADITNLVLSHEFNVFQRYTVVRCHFAGVQKVVVCGIQVKINRTKQRRYRVNVELFDDASFKATYGKPVR